MLAHRGPAASLPLATKFTLLAVRPNVTQNPGSRSSSNRERLLVEATTLNDLSLERSEQITFPEPATEDGLQHPTQVLDDRQLLQEYELVRRTLRSYR